MTKKQFNRVFNSCEISRCSKCGCVTECNIIESILGKSMGSILLPYSQLSKCDKQKLCETK